MFKTLLKINILSLFYKKKNKKKRKPFFTAVFILFGAYAACALALGVNFLLSPLAVNLPPSGLDGLYFSVSSILIFSFAFIGSVFAAQNLIFNAKDNETLLSMPIPPLYVLFSRLVPLMVLNLLYGIIIAVPALAAYFRSVGFSAAVLSSFVAATALIIIFSSAITCILGWVGALVSSRFKRAEFLQTVVGSIFFAAYFAVCFNFQKYIFALIENGAAANEAIKKFAPAFYYFGVFCSERSFRSFAVFALLCVVPFVVSGFVAAKSFVKIATRKKSSAKTKYVAKELKVSSVKSALLKKELKRFFTSPVLFLNCAKGCFIQVAFSALVSIRGRSLLESFSRASGEKFSQFIPVIIGEVMGFCAVTVNSPAYTISLEGEKINALRAFPISSDDFYFSKFASNYIIGAPSLFICSVVSCAALGVEAVATARLLVLLALFFAVSTLINLIAGARSPKFSWNNEAAIVTQSGSGFVGLLGGLAETVAVFAPFFFAADRVSANVYSLLAQAFLVLCGGGAILFLKTAGKKKFELMNV